VSNGSASSTPRASPREALGTAWGETAPSGAASRGSPSIGGFGKGLGARPHHGGRPPFRVDPERPVAPPGSNALAFARHPPPGAPSTPKKPLAPCRQHDRRGRPPCLPWEGAGNIPWHRGSVTSTPTHPRHDRRGRPPCLPWEGAGNIVWHLFPARADAERIRRDLAGLADTYGARVEALPAPAVSGRPCA